MSIIVIYAIGLLCLLCILLGLISISVLRSGIILNGVIAGCGARIFIGFRLLYYYILYYWSAITLDIVI